MKRIQYLIVRFLVNGTHPEEQKLPKVRSMRLTKYKQPEMGSTT